MRMPHTTIMTTMRHTTMRMTTRMPNTTMRMQTANRMVVAAVYLPVMGVAMRMASAPVMRLVNTAVRMVRASWWCVSVLSGSSSGARVDTMRMQTANRMVVAAVYLPVMGVAMRMASAPVMRPVNTAVRMANC